MKIQEALENMVSIAMTAMQMDEAMHSMGYDENPYADIYACAFDALYYLTGEQEDEITNSLTYTVLHDPLLTNDDRVNILLGA